MFYVQIFHMSIYLFSDHIDFIDNRDEMWEE